MKVICKPMSVPEKITETKLQTTRYGCRIHSFIKEAVKHKFIKQKSVNEYLKEINKRLFLGTCAGEAFAVSKAKIKTNSKSKNIIKSAKGVDAIAKQIVEHLRTDMILTVKGSTAKEIRNDWLKTVGNIEKVVKKEFTKLQKKHKHQPKQLKQIDSQKKRSSRQLARMRAFAKNTKNHELAKITSNTQLKKAVIFSKKLINENDTAFKEFAGLKPVVNKNYRNGKAKHISKKAYAEMKDLLSSKKNRVIQISCSGSTLGHAVVLFNAKRPQIYDAQRGLVQYKSIEDLSKDLKKHYFKPNNNPALMSKLKHVQFNVLA